MNLILNLLLGYFDSEILIPKSTQEQRNRRT